MQIKNKKQAFITLKEAAAISGYASDYIGYLIRRGEIAGQKIYLGDTWKVSQEAIIDYAKEKNKKFISQNWWGKLFSKYKYISLKSAAELLGYTPDYIGWLIRKGKIQGKKIHSQIVWVTTEESIKNYLEKKKKISVISKPFTHLWREGFLFSLKIPKYALILAIASGIIIFSGVVAWAVNQKNQIQTAEIYPAQIQGDWQNAEKVQGAPENGPTADLDSFSAANSAVYEEGALSLVLSDFNVTQNQSENDFVSAKIKFSLAIREKITKSNSTSEESVLGTSTIETMTPPEEATTTEEEIESPPESLPPIETASSTSFWNKIKNFFGITAVKAEEDNSFIETTTPIIETTTPMVEETTTPSVEPLLTDEQATSATESENQTSTEGEFLSTSTQAQEIFPDLDAKIIIWWSLDGENWQKLDAILSCPLSNASNGGYFEYDAPFLKNWDDVKNLKIKFEGVETSIIAYLDSVWLEVGYQEKKEQPLEEKKIEFINPKESFRSDEEPEFFLPNDGTFSCSQIETQKMVLIGPNNTEVLADIVLIGEGENYRVKIRKLADFQPGKYSFKIKISCEGEIYIAKTEFNWEKVHIPKERFSFSLENQPLPSKKDLPWYPSGFQSESRAENSDINVDILSNEEESGIIFSGRCQKEYYVILMYRGADDYEKNPGSFIYNKAFPCRGGNYQYELKDLPLNLDNGIYYFLVAEQGRTGPWQPITAIQPVRIEKEYK